MSRFHVNPQTGNPNVCRAKVQCRFGGATEHYDSREEAEEGFRQRSELSAISMLSKTKLSKGARILVALDRAQQALVTAVAYETPTSLTMTQEFQDRLKLRNHLQAELANIPWDATDAPEYDASETVVIPPNEQEAGKDRIGWENGDFDLSPEILERYRQLDVASAVWMRRLSTAEIKAIALYNADATDYAKAVASPTRGEDENFVKYFHSALAKAPRSDQPFTVYAGISSERVKAARRQLEERKLRLERIQSTSFNPAQINSFMYESEPLAKDELAIEVKTDRVASLSAFNVNRHEMELLIPPGDYTVDERFQGLKYEWGNGLGLVAQDTYVLQDRSSTSKEQP